MAFQPFGYRFEILSKLAPSDAKAALRSRTKGWFESRNGPRGWIVGPVICLWLSALNRRGPMLLGCISEHDLGTRIRGRAGSDLNGVIWASVLFPALAFLFYKLLSEGGVSTPGIVVFGIILLLSPTIFWFAHEDRRQAEPLVNFIRRALGVELAGPKSRVPRSTSAPLPMQLIVCGDQRDGEPATADAIQGAVAAIEYDPNGCVLLERADEFYMQAAVSAGGFVLEKREGSADAHFVAKRLGGGDDSLSADDISDALIAYLEGRSEGLPLRWERLRL